MGGISNKFAQMQQNPMFMAGLGLLSGNQTGQGFQGLMQGLSYADQARTKAEEKRRREKLKRQLLSRVRNAPGATPPYVPEMTATSTVNPDLLPATPPPQMPSLGQMVPALIEAGEYGTAIDIISRQDDLAQQMDKENRAFKAKKDMAEFEAQLSQQYPGAFGSALPSSLREWNAYQQMSPEDQQAYLLMKRGAEGPSQKTEDALYGASDSAIEARANVQKYTNLADRMIQIAPTAGVLGSLEEKFKALVGTQDAATLVRKDWTKLRNSAAVQDLPPGVASDKDIELVLAGFLPENANPETIAQFMRGLAKLEEVNAAYNEFKSDYISSDPGRGPVGLNRAWRDYAPGYGFSFLGQESPLSPPSVPTIPRADAPLEDILNFYQ